MMLTFLKAELMEGNVDSTEVMPYLPYHMFLIYVNTEYYLFLWSEQ